MSNKIQLSRAETKEKITDILIAFDEFAKANNIRYSLGAGTLLGAIRHQGFIPWDDDIDVYVPRPDYEKIVAMAKAGWASGDLRFTGFEIDDFPMPFIKMINSSIEVVDRATRKGIPLHLWIDIFPVDGMPDDPMQARRLLKTAKILIYLIKAGNYRFLGAGRTRAKRIAKMIAIPIVKACHLNSWAEYRLISIAKSNRYEESKTVCDVVWNAYGVGEIIDRLDFEEMSPVRFEGRGFPATTSYDKWLKGFYGDYMALPPKEQRVSHGVIAMRKGN